METSISAISLIINEINTITSSMRKTQRFSNLGVANILSTTDDDYIGRKMRKRNTSTESRENSLMLGFTRLKNEIGECEDITQFDTPTLLFPFLNLIRSASTSGYLTSLGLNSVLKIFSYSIINIHSPRLSQAMVLLSSAITHCRFEASSDSLQDEIVLLRIVKLMEVMICGDASSYSRASTGLHLTDGSICEMMETGLSMCCQMRLSEMLRRSAEMAMISMSRVVFGRLRDLSTHSFEALDPEKQIQMGEIDGSAVTVHNSDAQLKETLDVSQEDYHKAQSSGYATDNEVAFPNADNTQEPNGSEAEKLQPVSVETKGVDAKQQHNFINDEAQPAEEELKPYGLASIKELLRVLVSLLDPHDRRHTDSMRIISLKLLDVAFETVGTQIGRHPVLRAVIIDDLCKYLLQLIRSDSPVILSQCLRLISTILHTARTELKLQQESLLTYIIACLNPRVGMDKDGFDPLIEGIARPSSFQRQLSINPPNNGRSTPSGTKQRGNISADNSVRSADAKESLVECVGGLVRIPSYFVELFVNYDCDPNLPNLCEELIQFLSRNAFPDAAGWSTTNVPPLCLDSLLVYIDYIFGRLEKVQRRKASHPLPSSLGTQRLKKSLIVQGASKFNEKPIHGIKFWVDNGIIDEDQNALSIATILKATTRTNKKLLGEYLAKPDNKPILSEFIDLFNFRNKRIDEALREMLGTFRLPGESQQIERIMEKFSEKYMAGKPLEVASSDAAYVLSYAIIMLNTDLFNPQNKRKMTLVDFQKMVKGVNDRKDFDPKFLEDVYNSIKSNEIIMPEEHNNRAGFETAWKEIQSRALLERPLLICDTNEYDELMFASTWRPPVATLAYVFNSATDDAVFQRVVTGFEQCAEIAAKFNLPEVIDYIVVCLASITNLASEDPQQTDLNKDVEIDGQKLTISPLSIKLGRDFKAQLALVVLFRIFNRHCNAQNGLVRKAWRPVVQIILSLHANNLLPLTFTNIGSSMEIQPIRPAPPPPPPKKTDSHKESGLFTTLSSYLSSYAGDEPGEPSNEEIESSLSTMDCLLSCKLDETSHNILSLSIETTKHILPYLLPSAPPTKAQIETSNGDAAEIIVSPDGPSSISPASALSYDSIFLLELATSLTLRNKESLETFGRTVIDSLWTTIRDAHKTDYVIVERSLVFMLRLLRECSKHLQDIASVKDILFVIGTLDDATLDKCAASVATGLLDCVRVNDNIARSLSNTEDYTVLRRLSTNKDAVPLVFELAEMIATEQHHTSVTPANYGTLIRLLNEFAIAGKIGARDEQKQEYAALRREKPTKQQSKPHAAILRRATRSIELIYALHRKVNKLIEQAHVEEVVAWNQFWNPIFAALSQQCYNPCRQVRNFSFSHLQRALLSSDLLLMQIGSWTSIFDRVLFPMIGQLLKPETYQSDPRGMSETRVQSANLLCKVFLHYIGLLSDWEGLVNLWLRILDIMDRFMNSGQRDHLDEAVPESLKNVLLVMNTSGYLLPPSEQKTERDGELWDKTWAKLDQFLPSLKDDLFPDLSVNEQAQHQEKEASGDVGDLTKQMGQTIIDDEDGTKDETDDGEVINGDDVD